jgi:hypothetical protein
MATWQCQASCEIGSISSLAVHWVSVEQAQCGSQCKIQNSKLVRPPCLLGLGLCDAAMEDRASELTRLIAASCSLHRHHKHSCHRELGLQQLPFPHTRCPRFVCVFVSVCVCVCVFEKPSDLDNVCNQRMSESWTGKGQEHGTGEPHQH